MHRIDTATAQKDKFGAGKNGFTRGNPQTGTPATDLDDDYFDMLQEELVGVVEASGIAPDKAKHDQLLTALKKLLLSRSNPFGDIKADGAAAIATALANLQLREAAKRDVGTDANQIPDMSAFEAQLSLSGYAKEPSGLIRQWIGGNTGGMVAGEAKVIELPFPFPSGILAVVPYTGALAPGFGAGVGVKWTGKNQITLYNSSMTQAIADYGFIAYGR